ncbi:hypothetical protein STEG23_030813 [Scotinomys teguina]
MAASARDRVAGEQLGVGRLLRRGWEWIPVPESKQRRSARVGRGGRLRGSPFVCAVPKWLRPGRAAAATRCSRGPGDRSARSRSPGTKALSGQLKAEKQIPDGKAPCWKLTATDPFRVIGTSEQIQ